MTETTQSLSEPERNNNNIVPGAQTVQRPCWGFTMPEKQKTLKSLMSLLLSHCKEFEFQLEKGEETGYLHYQGWISLKKKKRWQQIVDIMECDVRPPSKNAFALKEYCKKNKTRVAGPWNQDTQLIRDRFLEFEPFEWQKEILDIIKQEADDRTLYWRYSPTKGKMGKTLLAKHICIKSKKNIFVSGKSADIKSAICTMQGDPEVVIFYFTKTVEDYVSYEAIESVKDGLFFSGKYESGMKIYDNPHVICLANFKPNKKALMPDRWNIKNIETGQESDSESDTDTIMAHDEKKRGLPKGNPPHLLFTRT
nr:MAG: replication associated protein [Cressdnaviricota sp.]